MALFWLTDILEPFCWIACAVIEKYNPCNELNEKLTRKAVHITSIIAGLKVYPGVSDDVIICYRKFNSIVAWKLSHYTMFNFTKM